jgi:hypothetical protein
MPEPKIVRYPTSAPPCRPSQLRVGQGRTAAATGNLLEELVFTNVSARACLLRGRPTVTGEAPSGERRALGPRHDDTFFAVLVPADLAPGGHVFLDFGTSDCGCRCEQPNPVRYRKLVFSLPQGGRVSGDHVSIVVDCFLDMSAFGLPERVSQPQAAPGTPGTLRASVRLPATARLGATLRYVVILSNPTPVSVVLTPCPGYTEYLGNEGGGAEHAFALNCAARDEVPPQGDVAYEMKLEAPTELLSGPAKLAWHLNTPTGPFTAGVVRIASG